MSSLTSPHRFASSLETISDRTIPAIIREYTAAYEYSFGRRDKPSLTEEEVQAGRLGHRSKGPAADPTGEIVIEQRHTRNVLRTVGKRVDRIVGDLESVRGQLEQLFEDDDYSPLRGLTIPTEETKQQQRQAEAAKRKRDILAEIERHEREAARLRKELRKGAA